MIKEFKNKIKIVKADIFRKGSWTKYFKNVKAVFHLAALADIVPRYKIQKNTSNLMY